MNKRLAAWKFVSGTLLADGSEQILQLRNEISSSHGLWPQIVGWADAHLVTPAVYIGLREKSLLEQLPEDARQYLQSIYEMNSSRNAALLGQLDEAVSLLNSRGIVPVLLKGAAYLKTGVYRDKAARILSDLDLLVEERRIPDALEVLRGVGYAHMKSASDLNPEHKHCAPLVRPGVLGSIEVHRRVFDRKPAEILPVDAVWNDLVVEREGDLCFSSLSPTKTMLASFLHSQIEDRFDAKFIIGLRPIQDLLALHSTYGEQIDWSGIRDLLERFGEDKAFRHYLYAARQLTGLAVLPDRFGLGTRVHYGACRAMVRWKTMEDLGPHFDEFTGYGIRKIYGNDQNPLSLTYYRGVRAVRKIARVLRRIFVIRKRSG